MQQHGPIGRDDERRERARSTSTGRIRRRDFLPIGRNARENGERTT
jgi:hypothetical protein